MVDLFAPGIDIFTTFPGNKYGKVEGTSQAAPMVSGVAALVWSYFPELTAVQLKKVLMKSTVKYKKNIVRCPGNQNKTIEFGELSNTGGILNTYQAILETKKYLKK
jgi:subtilisin family serine protease